MFKLSSVPSSSETTLSFGNIALPRILEQNRANTQFAVVAPTEIMASDKDKFVDGFRVRSVKDTIDKSYNQEASNTFKHNLKREDSLDKLISLPEAYLSEFILM